MMSSLSNVVGALIVFVLAGALPPPLAHAGETPATAPTTAPATQPAGKDHWSFQPIHQFDPPDLNDPWCISDIDRFVMAKLKEHQLKPAGPASKSALIRRATLDLLGLPPTPEEVDAFLKDERPDAFARVVDRLLESSHYGERWGRYWLDLARYSDDEGNSFLTPTPTAYIYRDWVIRAFNKDTPYNQFIRLQLAGDLMPEPTTDYVERLGGLGFQGLGPSFRKGAAGEAKAKADELEDRVDTLSRGLLALTVSCARCHNHKFDPIPTREYYGLAAAYNGANWSPRILGSPQVVADVMAREKQAADQKDKVEKWPAEEGKLIGRRELARLDQYLNAAWQVRAQRAQQLKLDEAAIARHFNLQPYFVTRLANYLASDKLTPVFYPWRTTADEAIALANVDSVVEDFPIVCDQTLQMGAQATAALDALGRQEAKQTGATLDSTQQTLLKALWQDGDAPFAVSGNDAPALLTDAERKQFEEEKARLQSLQTPLPTDPPRSPSVSGGGDAMHIFVRGNPEQLGDSAPPGFLSILQTDGAAAKSEHFNRLDLADAIVDPKNPLTARVFVNRVWNYHFGRGIVSTLGNFGALGERPSHPELLDTLAARFIQNGWSIKWLHRQIMLTSTYQMSSAVDPENQAKDAENKFLWHYATRRLDVEAWRDSMLAVSGKLDSTMFGPALDPKEPGEKEAGFPGYIRLRGVLVDDPNNGRRTVYCIVSRYAPSLALTLFDFPEPNVASDHRNVTTIPQQQLFVLNSPFAVAMSQAFAKRLATAEPSSDDHRLELAWHLAYGRSITPREADRCRDFLQLPPDASDKLTRWEQLCQAMLSSNELAFIP